MQVPPIISDLLQLRFPAELLYALAGGCALLITMFLWLIVRRVLTARQHDVRQAANLFAVRDIAAFLQADGPVDTELLRQAIATAPLPAVLQTLRLLRGDQQALVIAQAELAGTFDPALRELERGVASREIAALKLLQFARAPRFRSAVLKQVTRGSSPLIRCEALYTFIAMGSAPSLVALGIWIEATGPAFTPRHDALFKLIAERLPGALPHLAQTVFVPHFREQLAALAAQRAVTPEAFAAQTAAKCAAVSWRESQRAA